MSLKKRLLAGAGVAALMGVSAGVAAAVVTWSQGAGVTMPPVQMAQADIGGALSDIFARESATMAYLDYLEIPDGVDGIRTKFGSISRTHSWAVVDYLEDLRAQCDAPLVDDCAQDIKEKILGVFAGYESTDALKDWDKTRMDVFEAIVRHDAAIQGVRSDWAVLDVDARRDGLQLVVNVMSNAFSDQSVWFRPAEILLQDIADPTVAAYYQAVDEFGHYEPAIVFRPTDLATLSFEVAWDLAVHESGHNIRQQQMYMLDDPQFDDYFIEHGIRHDIRLLQLAAFEVPVQYGAVDADGWRRWHAMNPAEKDVIGMAARSASFFASFPTFAVSSPKMVEVAFPKPRPANL